MVNFNCKVNEFHEQVQYNETYKFSNIQITEANKSFKRLCDFELRFTKDTIVSAIKDPNIQTGEIMLSSFNEIYEMEDKKELNTVGIIKYISDISTYNTSKRRDIVLLNEKMETIKVTCWNNYANKFDQTTLLNPIMLINLKKQSYSKESVSTASNTTLIFETDQKEFLKLKRFSLKRKASIFEQETELEKKIHFKYEQLINLNQQLASKIKKLKIKCIATIIEMKELYIYIKCMDCNKRSSKTQCDYCETNNTINNYSICVHIADHTNSMWVNLPNKTIEQYFRKSKVDLNKASFQEIDMQLKKLKFKEFEFKIYLEESYGIQPYSGNIIELKKVDMITYQMMLKGLYEYNNEQATIKKSKTFQYAKIHLRTLKKTNKKKLDSNIGETNYLRINY
jgi:hypothetical protein